MDYNFYYQWNEQFIFISKDATCSFFDSKKGVIKPMKKVKYRCKDYLVIKGTSRRISLKTIKNKIKKCNVIL